MNEKEIGEIRRCFRPDKSGITYIRGCYVNEQGEIVSQFRQSLATMTEEESETFLTTIRRTLSGTPGKNLMDITFDTGQVVDSEEHRLLMALRNSSLEDETAVQTFFQRAIQSLTLEGNYLILLVRDAYDIPYRSKDGQRQDDASSEVFSYILCSICPVKLTKPALSYYVQENEFHNLGTNWVVAAPELGFMFPAFDERSTNLYGALCYTRDTGKNHSAFIDAIFHQEAPMPAAAQKETFQTILGDTLADDCRYEVIQAVREQLCYLIEEHKTSKEPEPLVISKGAVKQVLESCGVSEPRVTAFDEKFDDAFGEQTQLIPWNIIDTKQMEVRTPDVTIRVSPGRGDLIQTRIIDGVKYILIRADSSVEVDGVDIHIS